MELFQLFHCNASLRWWLIIDEPIGSGELINLSLEMLSKNSSKACQMISNWPYGHRPEVRKVLNKPIFLMKQRLSTDDSNGFMLDHCNDADWHISLLWCGLWIAWLRIPWFNLALFWDSWFLWRLQGHRLACLVKFSLLDLFRLYAVDSTV